MQTLIKSVGATLTSAFLFAGPLSAQEESLNAESTAEAKTLEIGTPALWKVADDDTTIYLFGTVHALPPEVKWYSSTIENALTESDSIVTEIKIGPGIEQEMQSLIVSRGVLPNGTTLRSLLNDEQVRTYEAALEKLAVPAANLDQFEPWYAGMLMSMLPLLQQGYSLDSGVDEVLVTKADGKKQGALETVSFQISVFDGLPQESQIKFLLDAADSIDEIKPTIDAMVTEWLEGDAESLAVIMNEGLTDPILAESLLYSRNRNWAEWVDQRLDEPGTVFVAVGAGHLAGDKSVQDYLAEREIETVRVQ